MLLASQLHNEPTQNHALRRKRLSIVVAVIALTLLWVQPVAAQAIGPVYALPGTLSRVTDRSYDTILTIPNGIQYGLVGQTPDIEARIVQYRSQGANFEVKVWGDRYPAVVEDDLQYIVVSSIEPADAVVPTPAETSAPPTPAPTSEPTAAPTTAPTAQPTPVVPVAVVNAAAVNVRSGPGTDYGSTGTLAAGQTCAVTGRNQASTWWQLSCPGINGWVFGELLALAGPVASVPVMQVAPPPPPVPPANANSWRATYFDNRNLSGNPVLVANVPEIDFNWGTGSPGDGVPADNFSARFERTLDLAYGTYELSVTMDDGARVYVDDALIIDAWNEGGVRTRTNQLVLSGARRFRVEYFEVGEIARIHFSVRLISSSEAWTATYYRGKGFRSPILTRGEPRSNNYRLDYNWGRGSPADGVPVDEFSARWVGTFYFDGGDYRFNAVTDDGIRVYIDGILILDRWLNGYYEVSNVFRGLGAGNHQITVEYYESFGDALVRLWWDRVDGGGGGGGGGGGSGRPRDE